jgi:fluoride exporter
MCATGLVAPKEGVTDGKGSKLKSSELKTSKLKTSKLKTSKLKTSKLKTSKLPINRTGRIALDRWLYRLFGRCARRTRHSDTGCRPDCRMFGTACGKSEGRALNIQFIIAVAVGGSIGSVARYLVGIGSGKLFGINFPWGTLITNVTGSFLIGLFVNLFAARWDLPQAVRIFLTVGICGGYTTFSTFSLDTVYLMERGEAFYAGAYMAGSVVLSVGALMAAMQLTRIFPN